MSTRLQHAPSDIVRQVLIDLGLASATGTWPCTTSKELDKPDNCLTCYDDEPQHDGRAMSGGQTFQHYGIQVRVRSATLPVGRDKAEAILHSFSEVVEQRTVTVGSTQYRINCFAKLGIVRLGEMPGSQRQLHVINGIVSITAL